MRVVRLVTGVLSLTFAAALLIIGGGLAFGSDATDISEANQDFRLIGFVLLLIGAVLGWIGWRLVARRRTRPVRDWPRL